MKLFVLGSGSRGNAFAVTAGGVTLLVDAGFGGKTLMSRVKSAGLDADASALLDAQLAALRERGGSALVAAHSPEMLAAGFDATIALEAGRRTA